MYETQKKMFFVSWLGDGVVLTRSAVMTKSSAWPAFVLQSWKSSFHIGTICTVTSDPAQRRRRESTRRFALQKHKAFHSDLVDVCEQTENTLAQVNGAHTHTHTHRFVRHRDASMKLWKRREAFLLVSLFLLTRRDEGTRGQRLPALHGGGGTY